MRPDADDAGLGGSAEPVAPPLDDVRSKLTHYLGMLDQITPVEAQHRRTGDLNLTVAELRVLVASLARAPQGDPPGVSQELLRCDGCGNVKECYVFPRTLDGSRGYQLCLQCIHNAARIEEIR